MAAKNKGPDWNAIKADYLRGGTSYRKLADKYGVSCRTIERRAKAESWGDACRQVVGKVSAELTDKIADTILKEASEVASNHFRLWEKLLKKAEGMLEATHQEQDPGGNVYDLPTVGSTKQLRELAASIKDITQGQRLASGMPNEAKTEKVDPLTEQDENSPGFKGALLLPVKEDDDDGSA